MKTIAYILLYAPASFCFTGGACTEPNMSSCIAMSSISLYDIAPVIMIAIAIWGLKRIAALGSHQSDSPDHNSNSESFDKDESDGRDNES